jgi:hypothetical protein
MNLGLNVRYCTVVCVCVCGCVCVCVCVCYRVDGWRIKYVYINKFRDIICFSRAKKTVLEKINLPVKYCT